MTGVEPNARLRAVAESRAGVFGVSNLSFIHGLAGGLPFEDSSIDLVWCERVLQHLADPQLAINDIPRGGAAGWSRGLVGLRLRNAVHFRS